MATKALKIIGLLAIVAAAFAGGYIYKAVKGGATASGGNAGRKVLYWVDPMHPWYKSDKPGIAPDCGMKLEPVYASNGGGAGSDQPPPTTASVQITSEQQHLLGVRYGAAEWSAGAETIHAAGRVVPDETRIVKVQA